MKRIIIMIVLAFAVSVNIMAQSYELSRAKHLIENEEYKDAAMLLRPLAENGNAEAQYLAARLFLEGKGVIKSEEQAEKYYILATNGGNEQAAIELVEFYEAKGKKDDAAKLLKELCDDNSEKEKTLIGYKYGQYLYHGYGNTPINKQRGWGIIFRSKTDEAELLRDDFYTSLIQENKESPIALIYLLCDYYWLYSNTKKEWTLNYLDDAVLAIRTQKEQVLSACLSQCDSLYVHTKNVAAAIILSMVYAEGIGIEKDIDKAKLYYSDAIDDKMYTLLYENLYKHSDNGEYGHINKIDFPDFYTVVLKDYLERKERWDYQKKLENVKLTCSVPVLKLKSCSAYKHEGELTVAFEVYNTSPNPTGRTTYADNAIVKYNGEYIKAKVIYYISSDVGMKGHSITTFYVKIKEYMPLSGELEKVQFSISCDYGSGIIQSENVVWNSNVRKTEQFQLTKSMSQTDKGKTTEQDEIYQIVEEQPMYPGGMTAMMKFLQENIKYPKEAIEKRVEGRVIVQFVVNKDGSICNAIILKSVNPLLDAEALRVVCSMPNWTPGKQKGEPVRVQSTLPVSFRFSNYVSTTIAPQTEATEAK